MNIVTFSNKLYEPWVNVFMKSLLQHNPDIKKIVAMTNEPDTRFLYPCEKMVVDVPEGLTTKQKRVQISFATLNCFKLKGKWIFFDPDIMIRGNIRPIWELGHFSGCCSGTKVMERGKPQINCGMICYEDVDYDDLINHGLRYGETEFAEQDFVSDYFWLRNEVKILPLKYNWTPSAPMYKELLDERASIVQEGFSDDGGSPVVVHWAGPIKERDHPEYKKEWQEHLEGIYREFGKDVLNR